MQFAEKCKMKSTLIKFITIFVFLGLYQLSYSTEQKIKVQQMSPDADLSSLEKDYAVQNLKDLPHKHTFSISAKERDQYFAQAGLLDVLKKFDHLDRDLIFHITKKRGAAACIRKYPQLKKEKEKLQRLNLLLQRSNKK